MRCRSTGILDLTRARAGIISPTLLTHHKHRALSAYCSFVRSSDLCTHIVEYLLIASDHIMTDDTCTRYPAGTVTAIYMTSDGGSSNKSSTKLDQTYELVSMLAGHVEVVNQDVAAKFALEHHRMRQRRTQKQPSSGV